MTVLYLYATEISAAAVAGGALLGTFALSMLTRMGWAA